MKKLKIMYLKTKIGDRVLDHLDQLQVLYSSNILNFYKYKFLFAGRLMDMEEYKDQEEISEEDEEEEI